MSIISDVETRVSSWATAFSGMFSGGSGWIGTVVPLVEQWFAGTLSLGDLQSVIGSLPSLVVRGLEYIGSQRFPLLAPEFHAIAALTMSFHADSRIRWFQEFYNDYMTPDVLLLTDGVPGTKTDAAIVAVEAKFGLTVDGWLGKELHDFIVAKTGAAPVAAPA